MPVISRGAFQDIGDDVATSIAVAASSDRAPSFRGLRDEHRAAVPPRSGGGRGLAVASRGGDRCGGGPPDSRKSPLGQLGTTGRRATKSCPCSYLGHPTRPCVCGESEIVKYRSRLSGPLADRIDMQVTLTPVPLVNLDANVAAESSVVIRSRVDAARAVQRRRYAATRGVTCNAHASGRWLHSRGLLAADARRLLVEGSESLHLSARAYHRVLRGARTIADLGQSEAVTSEHVGEALRYRQH